MSSTSSHPGVTTVTTMAYESATGGYTRLVSVVDPTINLSLDPETRAPHTDEFSLAVDRQMCRGCRASAAYIRKRGRDFIGWTDTGGQYREETRTLANGTVLPVFALTNSTADRRFLLTNPGHALPRLRRTRRRRGEAFVARLAGLRVVHVLARVRPASHEQCGGGRAAIQHHCAPSFLTFGQDPNDLTNADGPIGQRPAPCLPCDGRRAPAVAGCGGREPSELQRQALGGHNAGGAAADERSADPARVVRAARIAAAFVAALFDVRVAKTLAIGPGASVDIHLDLLNLLNDSAEEALRSDVLGAPTFGQANVFMDPRRAMLSVRLNLGH